MTSRSAGTRAAEAARVGSGHPLLEELGGGTPQAWRANFLARSRPGGA
ncbi:hypothetical protein [Streptomyces sp. NPDC005004]